MANIYRTVREWMKRKPADRARDEYVLRQAYYTVFSGDQGQLVLADILRRGHIDQSTYTAGDPHLTSFKEGQRRLSLEILNLAKVGPDEEALIKAMMANDTSEVFSK